MICNDEILIMEIGIEPVIWFLSMPNFTKLTRFPISCGIIPAFILMCNKKD